MRLADRGYLYDNSEEINMESLAVETTFKLLFRTVEGTLKKTYEEENGLPLYQYFLMSFCEKYVDCWNTFNSEGVRWTTRTDEVIFSFYLNSLECSIAFGGVMRKLLDFFSTKH